MHIGIAGWCNPAEFVAYLDDNKNVMSIYEAATAVNTYIKQLLDSNHTVTIFTYHFSVKGRKNVVQYHGDRLHIYILSKDPIINRIGLQSRFYMPGRLKKFMEKHLDGIDVLHAQWTYDFALACKHFAKRLPVFCTVRDWCPYIRSIQRNLGGLSNKLWWDSSYVVFKMVMSGDAIHFIANSHYTYKCITDAYPDKEVAIIPNPIYRNDILKEKKYTLVDPTFVSISQAIFDPRKNIITLIKSFNLYRKEVPQAKLYLIGKYTQTEYDNVANDKTLSLDNIVFTGAVSHEQVLDYIDQSTCLVHPAVEETFGNILVEAMARHVVCVGGKKAGGVPQVLGNGKAGILCDVTDVNSLLDALKKSQDKEYIAPILDNANHLMLSQYASDVNMENTIKLYKVFL